MNDDFMLELEQYSMNHLIQVLVSGGYDAILKQAYGCFAEKINQYLINKNLTINDIIICQTVTKKGLRFWIEKRNPEAQSKCPHCHKHLEITNEET